MIFRTRLLAWSERLIASREPDFVVGKPGEPYMERWWVIPRNRFFNIYLHRFLRDDNDEALHDHPWPSCSAILSTGYGEVLFAKGRRDATFVGNVEDGFRLYRLVGRPEGSITFRSAETAHRIVLKRDAQGHLVSAISLFLTDPTLRTWGFQCPKGFIPYTQYADVDERSSVGKGCPQ